MKRKSQKDIVILCPGGLVTGGPELLHQLAHQLNSIGRRAFMCYYPFDRNHKTDERYWKYDAPQISADEVDQAICIVPEVATKHIRLFKNAEFCIWWLSVDNYFGMTRENRIQDLFQRIGTLWRGRVPIQKLKSHCHLVQSEYASNFLAQHGISSSKLTDYLSGEHFSKTLETKRESRILYNPRKGLKTTQLLKRALPEYEFLPLFGYSPKELSQLFSSSKLYIDFGHHPGKDRMPREAAMAGCCIVTNKRGSAAFYDDVSIPDDYKIDDTDLHLKPASLQIFHDIIENFTVHQNQFGEYRNRISMEKKIFASQVCAYFGN